MEPLIHDFTINYPCFSLPFKVGYQELIQFYTELEPQTKQYYCDTIKPDWNVVDVGANIGMFTLLFGKLTREKVFAIEGSHDNYQMLIQNLNHGSYTSDALIVSTCKKVSNKPGVEKGEIHYLWTGRGSVARESGEFEFDTLDNILDHDPLRIPIHLIKIDIDGYDFEAVQGATRIMEKHRPIFVIELVDEALALHGFNKQNVIDFMAENKYEITKILDNCNYVFEYKK